MQLRDMPKLESPFEREDKKGIGYVCIPKFKREFNWILDKDKVLMTEKFDGTNVSVYTEDNHVKKILNRKNNINIWKQKDWFYKGVKNAIEKKHFKIDLMVDGQYFGELIGPKINGNPYNLDEPIWLPFEYLRRRYTFKFYYDWLDENFPSKVDQTDEYIYIKLSDLIKTLKSLWFRQQKKEQIPEGVVFYNKETGKMCKLRADMFEWFKGKKHKWQEYQDKKED